MSHTLKVVAAKNNSCVGQEEWGRLLKDLMNYGIEQCLANAANCQDFQHKGFSYDSQEQCGQILCTTERSAAWWKNAVPLATNHRALATGRQTRTVCFDLGSQHAWMTNLMVVRSILVTNLGHLSQFSIRPETIDRCLDASKQSMKISAKIPTEHAQDLANKAVNGELHWPGGLVGFTLLNDDEDDDMDVVEVKEEAAQEDLAKMETNSTASQEIVEDIHSREARVRSRSPQRPVGDTTCVTSHDDGDETKSILDWEMIHDEVLGVNTSSNNVALSQTAEEAVMSPNSLETTSGITTPPLDPSLGADFHYRASRLGSLEEAPQMTDVLPNMTSLGEPTSSSKPPISSRDASSENKSKKFLQYLLDYSSHAVMQRLRGVICELLSDRMSSTEFVDALRDILQEDCEHPPRFYPRFEKGLVELRRDFSLLGTDVLEGLKSPHQSDSD